MKTMFNFREGAVVAIIVLFVGVFLTAPLASQTPPQMHIVLSGITNASTNGLWVQKISDTNNATVPSFVFNSSNAYALVWNPSLLAWVTNGVGSFTVQYSGPPQTVTGNFEIAVVPASGSMATNGVMTVNILGVSSANAQLSAFVGTGDVQNPITNRVVGHAAATTWPVLFGGTATVTPGP